MKRKFPRPTAFTYAVDEWHPQDIRDVLETEDQDLTGLQYSTIFAVGLPPGTYEESAYFLPLALAYMRTHPDESLNCISGLVWFVAEHSDALGRDGLIDDIRQSVEACVLQWTDSFQIEHFDAAACATKQWKLDHYDYLERAGVIGSMLEDLERFGRHGIWADRILDTLIVQPEPERAAWSLHLARMFFKGDIYHPPNRPRFLAVFNDREMMTTKRKQVENSYLFPFSSPTYWKDTLRLVGIGD